MDLISLEQRVNINILSHLINCDLKGFLADLYTL